MGKTAKSKLARAPLSAHSRAARRAEAPPTKTLVNQISNVEVYVPKTKGTIPAHHNAGISKKKNKAKPLSRSKRIRQEKGMKRAVAVLDQLDVKLVHSTVRSKKMKERGAAWDELNRRLFGEKENKMPGSKEDEEDWKDEVEGEDKQTADEDAVLEGVTALKVGGETPIPAVGTTEPDGGQAQAGEDEIL